ncbi:RNA ligase, Rnl2 family [Aquimarina spinulae]|uniref:RNA ligase, Rnl2 family n=1 Tax=Aquimarina spinulae TaxID=1192023 RepID=UPI000D54DE6F|nr:RNA ligase, Rnl2 family [Aquimarina spinulae]
MAKCLIESSLLLISALTIAEPLGAIRKKEMFKKYTSIENTYRDEFIDRIKGHEFWNDEFIVQEKVHGANLSYWSTNGDDYFSAKRTDQITNEEKFFNHDLILKELKPKLKNIWSDLKNEIENLKQLTIFGEIIGGDYPHKEVEIDRKAIMVQKGIFYSPKNHFYAFDILINSETYLDVDVVNSHFEKQKILHAKTIFRGDLKECLDYPNDFNSTLPKELNLPDLTPNVVEGVVIKPSKTRHFNNGVRVILKNKNEKWSENKKYHKSIKLEDELSDKVIKLQEAILTYVTENRLNNVVSKIGEISQKDFGRVLGMFNKDVVEDFLKDYNQITNELEKKELKLITKSFAKTAAELVKNKIKST